MHFLYVPDYGGITSYMLMSDDGSETQPYQNRLLGFMPRANNPDMGRPWGAADSSGNLHYIGILSDYRIWHLWEDGGTLQSEKWSSYSLRDKLAPQFIAGLDNAEQPFLSFGTFSGNSPVTCFVRKEESGIRSEVIESAELHGEVSIYNDFAFSLSGQIAFAAQFGEWDGADTTTWSLKVFVREPN
jgi:hypothetical protein